jgi:hypothetical protein
MIFGQDGVRNRLDAGRGERSIALRRLSIMMKCRVYSPPTKGENTEDFFTEAGSIGETVMSSQSHLLERFTAESMKEGCYVPIKADCSS